MLYFFLFLYFSIVASLEFVSVKPLFKVLVFYFSGLVLIIISGVRWKTGADWIPYYNLFIQNETFTDFFHYAYEPGYLFLNAFTKLYSDSYTPFLFLVTAIVITCKYRAILKCSPYPLITCLIAFSFYQGDLFSVRQSVAISITLFSTIYIIQRNKVKFSICILAAMSFHFTAVIFIIAYFFSSFKVSLKKTFISLILCFILMSVFNFANAIMSFIGPFFPIVQMKLDIYSSMEVEINSNLPLWLRDLIGLIKRMIFLSFFIFVGLKVNDRNYFKYLSLYTVSIYMTIILSPLHPSFNRMTMYFSIYEIFLLTYSIFIFRGNGRIFVFSIVLFYCALKFIYGFSQSPDLYFPFETIFDSEYKVVH